MPRAISFMLTQDQVLDGTKTQTRRLGWGLIRVKRVRRERLDKITKADVVAEGFPDMSPAEFVAFFVKANKCRPETIVTVIDFERMVS